jgi:tetratricopeptide (TPR) repeat protein
VHLHDSINHKEASAGMGWKLKRAIELVVLVAFAAVVVVVLSEPDPTAVAGPIGDCNSSDRQRRIEGCTKLIEAGDVQGSTLAVVLSLRADAYVGAGEWDKALRDLHKATSADPANKLADIRASGVLVLRGNQRLATGDKRLAAGDYQMATSSHPDNVEAWINRIKLAFESENIAEAIALGHLAIKSAPENIGLKRILAALLHERGARRAGNITADTFKDFDEATALDPSNQLILIDKARAYLSAGEYANASVAAASVIERDGSHVAARLLRAEAHIRGGTSDRALEDLNKVIEFEPRNAFAHALRGAVYDASGNRDAAGRDYQAAASIDPKMPTASTGPASEQSASVSIQIITNQWVEGEGDIGTFALPDMVACEVKCLVEPRCKFLEFYIPDKKCGLWSTVQGYAPNDAKDTSIGIKRTGELSIVSTATTTQKTEYRLQLGNDDSIARTFAVVGGDGSRQLRRLTPRERTKLTCIAPCQIMLENGDSKTDVDESGNAFSFQTSGPRGFWVVTLGAAD